MSRHLVANVKELDDKDFPILVNIDGLEIGIFHSQGDYYALANYCPHAGGPLCEGQITGAITTTVDGSWKLEKEGEVISCPWHGWSFDIKTGQNIRSDKYKIPTYHVEVENNELFISPSR